MYSESGYLIHYGTKGQKWGVRNYQNKDGTLTAAGKARYYTRSDGSKDFKRLKKDAANDAREYARAKAYYGEGAGTRRKKLKNKLSEKMKDPDYRAEFERNLNNQNMSKVQQQANRERKWNDTKKTVGQTANGVKNLMLGLGTTSLAAMAIYKMSKAYGLDKKLGEWGKQTISSIKSSIKSRKRPSVKDYNWQTSKKTSSNSSSSSSSSASSTQPTGPKFNGPAGSAFMEFYRRHGR